ncbi:hypothetical protein BH24ACT19_BH24ACT19_00010 [soil metagenome]
MDRGPEDWRSEDRGQDDERRRKSLAIGISLGIAIGARIGVAMDNLGLGMGIAIGVAFGTRRRPARRAVDWDGYGSRRG